MSKLDDLLQRQLTEDTLLYVAFGGLRKKSNAFKKVTLRPLLLQGQLCYQAEYHYEKKVTHENLPQEQTAAFCVKLLTETFKQANLFCADADYQILASKPDNPKIIKKPPTKCPETACLTHNQEKQYLIPDGTPCDFLIRLGVMDKSGKVIPKHYSKFRQINRFLEIVSDVTAHLPKQPKIIDFGCGKAYLTFALYYYLHHVLGKDVTIIGLDLKEDVICFCNQVAADLHYEHLQFQMGDIAEYDETARADMVVTLHACDTATDFALIKAVNWHASVILSVPCCQHELFSQLQNPLQQPILKQGILKERIAALLTDGLRCLKLEEHGYEVSTIEFTSLEHTAKNIMIRAVNKRLSGAQPRAVQEPSGSETLQSREKARREYEALKEYWHVNPTIDQL